MSIATLRKQQTQVEQQIDRILAGRETDDPTISPEEWAEIEALTAKDSELEAEIKAEEQAAQEQTQRVERLATYRQHRSSSVGRLSVPNGGRVVQVSEPEWMKDRLAYGYRDVNDNPRPRLFFLDVMRATLMGIESPQLKHLRMSPDHVRMFAAAGSDEQSGISDPFGGYAVPMGFMPELLQRMPEGDPTAGRTQDVPMSSPSVAIPARVDHDHTTSVTGGLRVYRRAETDTVASSRMEMEQITLRAQSLMGISYATEEILVDSPLSFAAILEQGFNEEFASRMLEEKISGSGVGQFLGILNSPSLVTATRAGAGLIAYNDVTAMRARIWRYTDAIWLANHDTLPQLMAAEISAGGVVVWQPSLREDRPDLLLGRPVFFTEYVPGLGNTGDLICASWSQYLEGTYQPLDSAESIHVRFLNNERTFRFTMRNDGQPWWRAPLTPKNGANTLSPFVALAA